MRDTKYITSGGLAFSEDKDMEKLREFSLKGWHVSDFKFMGYLLEKGQSNDYIYSVDYRLLTEEEAGEYFDVFSLSGWTHITSQGDIHLFRALPGTKPIYSDRETVAEKHGYLGSPMKWFAISMVLITVVSWLGALISTGSIHRGLSIIAVILSVIAIPTAWTVITIYSNKWRAEGKKGLVKLTKSLPILVFILAVSIILSVVDHSVRLIASMLIGAIALPTAIWAIMSLSQVLHRKMK